MGFKDSDLLAFGGKWLRPRNVSFFSTSLWLTLPSRAPAGDDLSFL